MELRFEGERYGDKPQLIARNYPLGLHDAELRQNALTGHQFDDQTDGKSKHGQATVPSFSECGEAEFVFLRFHNFDYSCVNLLKTKLTQHFDSRNIC